MVVIGTITTSLLKPIETTTTTILSETAQGRSSWEQGLMGRDWKEAGSRPRGLRHDLVQADAGEREKLPGLQRFEHPEDRPATGPSRN